MCSITSKEEPSLNRWLRHVFGGDKGAKADCSACGFGDLLCMCSRSRTQVAAVAASREPFCPRAYVHAPLSLCSVLYCLLPCLGVLVEGHSVPRELFSHGCI